MNKADLSTEQRWPRLQVSDILILIGCGALGLAIGRWLDPHIYRDDYKRDAEWLFMLTACAAVSMGLARRSYGNGRRLARPRTAEDRDRRVG